jgi:hypothetical protein
MLLRWAWANRQAAGVTVTEIVEEHEIRGYSGFGETSWKKVYRRSWKPDRIGWYDLDDITVLATCFDVKYSPTIEQCFGLGTPADSLIESKQYTIAHEIVFSAMLDLDLAEWEMFGPASYSGFPHFVGIILMPEGVELAQQLARDLPAGTQSQYCLDPETESQYLQALACRGMTLDDIAKARESRNTALPDCTPRVSFFAGLLSHDDPAMRLAGARALSQIGPAAHVALSALETALKDPDRTVRMMAEAAVNRLKGNPCPFDNVSKQSI